ncbi:MAG: dehypoxanthine futalosine cyclase [Candidatus Firestonebacteria bacterium]|nr:dehypoxanthine futalosine cyclase [Candidatus Firestonebacteria bacterium]
MKSYNKILQNILSGKRLEKKEALVLLKEAPLPEIGKTANHFREKYKQNNLATFVVDRNINYTNICINHCSFCAFYRDKDSKDAYVLSDTEILEKVKEAHKAGATQIMLQGGLHPDLPFDYYINMLVKIKSAFKNICIHSFSPPEIIHFTKITNYSISDILTRLKEAGLNSIPGGGAEILEDRIRGKISPKKITGQVWLNVMEQAHNHGFKTTATMMMGSIESFSDRLTHLEYIRNLQDKTKGFRAFIPWIFQPGHTELGGRKTSTYDYLKTLAISRLFLDNIPNIHGSWVTCGKEIGQISLWYGANDLGSIMLEENVVKATGVSYRLSKNEMIDLIRTAGLTPAQRDTEYNIIKTY